MPSWVTSACELVVRSGRTWRPYALAVVAVALATLLRAALQPVVGERLPFTLYFPALGLAAAFGGFAAGLFALALSLPLVLYLFLPPLFTWQVSGTDAVLLATFAIAALVLVVAPSLLNRALHLLLQQRDALAEAKALEAEHHALLVRELEHRMRNLFGLVELVAARTLQGDAESRQTLRNRIGALAAASSASTGERPTVQGLLDRAVGPYAAQVSVRHCETIALELLPSQQLALIFHELATNAAKYGALSVPTGRVSIACAVERQDSGGGGVFRFTWEESGGPPVVAPRHRGFGTDLLVGAPRHAGAKVALDYLPGGVRYDYAVPLARLVSPRPRGGDGSRA